MKTIKKRLNIGYEIQLYYPKENGKYTSITGKEKEVILCDNIGEVAQWFARNSWAAPYEDSNVACPTVWFNGKKWSFQEYGRIDETFYYKGFLIRQNPFPLKVNNGNDIWMISNIEEQELRGCASYSECIERIDTQTV